LGEIYSISSSARSVEGTLLSKIRLILRQWCSREEAIMVDASKLKMDKIEHPAAFYTTPDDVVKDNDLSAEEKKKALNSWEQDARQQLTASTEGMAGSKEGVDPSDHPRLGEIQRAKDKIGEKPKHKPSQ